MTFQILVVCTGNMCRSPLAAGLLRQALHDLRVDARVSSAGTNAPPRGRVPSEALVAAQELGVDLRDHVARPLSEASVRDAGLVLVMTRAHLRHVAHLDGSAFRRTATLVAAASNADRSRPEPFDPVQQLVGKVMPLDLFREVKGEDIPDPIGRPLKVHRAVAAQVSSLIETIADVWRDGG